MTLSLQRTIDKPARIAGPGLFSGRECTVRFLPAAPDSGIVFVRKGPDGPEVSIPCNVANLVKRDRRTALASGETVVDTVEHVLSAIVGMGIDNIAVELDAEELPSVDSSPQPFVQALTEGGICEQQVQRKVFVIEEAITVADDSGSIAALPGGGGDDLDLIYELDYGQGVGMDRQLCSFHLGRDDYAADIAPARTFLLEEEGRQLQAAGVGTHLTARDVVVVNENGVVDNELRFSNEQARHKVADLIGDLALAGVAIAGRIVACRSGHRLNQDMAQRLAEAASQQSDAEAIASERPAMDIHKIMRLLPHRYPFLMVDRVLEIDGDRRAVGVKNVTINEPFFHGHYPDQPIMPGVLILEAMAQLSGLLLGRHLEITGKVAVLLSMDRVKMRRPVRPGDQLILEAEAVRVRGRTGHCRCRALVDGKVAAEAEVKFMLIDPEPA